MKRFLIILVAVVALLNGIYIAHEFKSFNDSEQMLTDLMSMGIGTNSEHKISGSLYGKEYKAIYKMDGNIFVRTMRWN